MLEASTVEAHLRHLNADQLRTALSDFIPANATTAEKADAVASTLRSPMGQSLRETMAQWIVDEIVPVERLVPKTHLKWRPPVRDSMIFVVARLSPERLAPKLVEQLELPRETTAEQRLLRLIAKVPGLQKLGQVIAHNRHLSPALRSALARLENGIRDVSAEEMLKVVQEQLGPRLDKHHVKIVPKVLSEASVSAVMRFTWRDPDSGCRQRGVFKVLKPHIPASFAEDMEYLQGLAEHFGDRHHRYGFPAHLIPDTFRKVRRLLQHEINFAREQKTLLEAAALYRNVKGVRIPNLIQPLCTRTITALSEEHGVKVTSAATRLSPIERGKVAEQLIEALIGVPLLAAQENVVFHGDPHAGNLLYNSRTGELSMIDWALREHLNREQRRHLALLFLMVTLRDPVGASEAVLALSQRRLGTRSYTGRAVRQSVDRFLDEMPSKYIPGAADAMRLLETVALKGVRFPAPLVMLSKVMVTLDGLLNDIRGNTSGMGFAIARRVALHWMTHWNAFRSPLRARDWVTLQCSAALFGTRMWLRYEQALVDRYLAAKTATAG